MQHQILHYIQLLAYAPTAEERRLAAEEILNALHTLSGNDNIADELVVALCDGLGDDDKGVRDMCAIGILKDTLLKPHLKARSILPFIAHKDIAIRNLAGDILLRLGEPSALALCSILPFSGPDEQKFALDIIGLTGSANFHAPKVVTLLQSTHINVCSSAVEALGNMHDTSSIPRLLELFSSNADIKPYILDALGNIGGEQAVHFLLTQLTDTTDEFLQIASIDALAHSADSFSIAEKLLQLIPNAQPELQTIILKTVSGIAFRTGNDLILQNELRQVAYRALYDDDEDTRIAGVLALGASYNSQDVQPIADVLVRVPPPVAEHILMSLVASPLDVAADVLRILSRSESVNHDMWYSEFLGRMASLALSIPTDHWIAMLKALMYKLREQPFEQQQEFVYFLKSVDAITSDALLDTLAQEAATTEEKEDIAYLKSLMPDDSRDIAV
jgi:HEAT repeat protein